MDRLFGINNTLKLIAKPKYNENQAMYLFNPLQQKPRAVDKVTETAIQIKQATKNLIAV